ncbi:beta-ketoacyl synthase N-terminal-like domain-containing protein [Plantibacter sp. CFBP 8775]|uniref:beta-ketoacyl synthase N-terminal-like domain-containing protein n=2 Tax=Microbacteriaceae TaxID=85023 RepID=UPI0018E088CE
MNASAGDPVRIIGRGAVTSVGANAAECFDRILSGHSGVALLADPLQGRYAARHAYELGDGLAAATPGRAGALLVEAIAQALAQAGLDEGADLPVIVGTGLGETRSAELAWIAREPLPTASSTLGEAVRARFGSSRVETISNACAASLYALAMASDLIDDGEAETVVVGGVDVISSSMFGLLDRVQPEPPEAVTPFDAERKGVLMGEGAAAVVLSRARRGPVLRGVALGCDAVHVTAPDPDGMAACIRAAHALAGVGASDVDVVFAHGTGTILNDDAEATAIRLVWTGRATPPVVAVKGATGHTSGGSGLFSLVMAAETLHRGVVPPILGLTSPTAAAAGLDLVTAPRSLPKHHVRPSERLRLRWVERRRRPRPGRIAMSAHATQSPSTGGGLLAAGVMLPELGILRPEHLRQASTRVDPDLQARLGRRGLRYNTRASLLAAAAALEAVAEHPVERGDGTAIVAATLSGSLETTAAAAERIAGAGSGSLSPMDLPNASKNVLAAQLAIRLGVTGVCLTVDDGFDGAAVLRWASRLLRHGRASRVLVVCAEAPSEVSRTLYPSVALVEGSIALLLGPDWARSRPAVDERGVFPEWASSVELATLAAPLRALLGPDVR